MSKRDAVLAFILVAAARDRSRSAAALHRAGRPNASAAGEGGIFAGIVAKTEPEHQASACRIDRDLFPRRKDAVPDPSALAARHPLPFCFPTRGTRAARRLAQPGDSRALPLRPGPEWQRQVNALTDEPTITFDAELTIVMSTVNYGGQLETAQ